MGSWWNQIGTSDEGGVAMSLPASFSVIDSSTSTSDSTYSSSTPIASSNIGFQLLKKHGWKEGTGLGVSEQGRLEPIQAHVKQNKRGLGAVKESKQKEKSKTVKDHSDQNEKRPSKRQKGMAKKIRKMQEFEKHLQEKEIERAIFREFWADNV